MYCPPHLDDAIFWLPNPLHIDVQALEENTAVEAQAPEDELVVLDATEAVARVPECDVITVYGDCAQAKWTQDNNSGDMLEGTVNGVQPQWVVAA